MRFFSPRQTQKKISSESSLDNETLEPLAPTAGARRGLDRRQVSLRWLSGSLLTGVFSLALFSGALYASLNGLYNFASTPRIVENRSLNEFEEEAAVKEARLSFQAAVSSAFRAVIQETDTRRVDGKEVIVSKPYVYLQIPLVTAAPVSSSEAARFNPAKLFSEAPQDEAEGEAVQAVASRLTLETMELNPLIEYVNRRVQVGPNVIQRDLSEIDLFSSMSDFTVADGEDEFFGPSELPTMQNATLAIPASYANGEVSFDAGSIGRKSRLSAVTPEVRFGRGMQSQLHEISSLDDVNAILARYSVPDAEVRRLVSRLTEIARDTELDTMRVALFDSPDVGGVRHVARLELNKSDSQIARIIRLTNDEFSPLALTHTNVIPGLIRGGLRRANLYESLYETAKKNDLPASVIDEFIRIHAFNADFNKTVQAQDYIELFYEPEGGPDGKPGRLLYAALNFDGEKARFYRFRTPDDGKLDYYDDRGRSARQFLLRKPLESGTFRSAFGMRMHPILRIRRMHNGVDWSAPPGTPIFAAGNGIVQEAKWSSGYGRWILIKHANGYSTGYAHMQAFAPHIAPGVEVRMGEVIGFVGSTGVSTGPHLHYEVMVNGRNVDPMRIRVPRERTLEGRTLAAFEKERLRLHMLMAQSGQNPGQFASAAEQLAQMRR